ncbi:MAG: potassium transporter [Lentisphaeria bacterium]|nr:potassium transporter [Lentisphaeria bacterium]
MKLSAVKVSQLFFIISFAGAIAVGTMLLRIPFCLPGESALSWVDAAFTATSAVCVTGLLTVQICDLTWLGQLIVLLLIQLGGLGVMALTASILVMLGGHLSYGGTLIMSTVTDRFSMQGLENLFRLVLKYTVICEGAGFMILFPLFWLADGFVWYQALWHALFHAVSAFCNAGISSLPSGMLGVSGCTKLAVALLFICGGLGVYVVYDILVARRKHLQLHAQTRLILSWTAALLVGGTVLLWGIQRFFGTPLGWVDAFFQSAACRTAGFNSVSLDALNASSILVMVCLMLIGAAPGSTGGGMKLTTVALVVAGLYSTFKGADRVILYKRMIPPENVLKAFVLLVTYIFLVAGGTILLCMLTPCDLGWALFESASALGTVGLSLENPVPLTAVGKCLLIGFMFLGRVGIFTFFLFLLGRERRSRLTYPEERIIMN